MKRTLIAGAAFASLFAVTSAYAADLPAYSKAPAVAAVYDWTGYYIGTNVGYSFGTASTNGTRTSTAAPTLLPLTDSSTIKGIIGGGQLGYNWQRGSWVYGLEADLQFSNEHATGSVCTAVGCPAGSFVFTRDYKLDWFGTARGRIGYLPAERILLYATGGLAYGNFSGSSWTLPMNMGWTVGAGAEAALGNNWSFKVEYLYMDLGNVGGSSATVAPTSYVFNTKFTDNIVRVGLNYKFGGPAAVVAKY
jgi:outer membrane immunogenic protein